MYVIYLAKNKINGKVYVGKTVHFEQRKSEHLSSKDSQLFHRALSKYGPENFEWSIIEDSIPDNSAASDRERYWIKFYHSFFRDKASNGYNMTKGGDGGNGWNVRKVASYSLDGNLLKTFESVTSCADFYKVSGSTCISYACSSPRLTCNGMMFRYFKDSAPKRIEKYNWKSPKSKPICKLDLNGNFIESFPSITSVQEKGYSRSGVTGCLEGYYKSSCGFLWCYENELDAKKGVPKKPISGRAVKQYTLDWNFLREFSNCADAARYNHINSYKSIHKAIKSKSHIAHGYRWIDSKDTPK